jgi:hypothetical protein
VLWPRLAEGRRTASKPSQFLTEAGIEAVMLDDEGGRGLETSEVKGVGHMTSKAGGGRRSVYDDDCRRIVERRPDAAVAWVLMASFLYYHDDQVILSDGFFDELCRGLAARWPAVRHPHKALLSPADLVAGSVFALRREEYPTMVVNAARRVLAEGVVAPPPPVGGQLALL